MNTLVSLLVFLFVVSVHAMDLIIIDDFSTQSSHGYQVKENITNKSLSIETFNITSSQDKKLYYQALENVIKNPPRVLNLSFGGLEYDYQEAEYLRKISDLGVYIVVGAGNHGQRLVKDTNVYPCVLKIENLLCVGALMNSHKTPSSNYGSQVKYFSDGSYKNTNATSFAAPKVSQAIAEIQKAGINPDLIIHSTTISIEGNDQWLVDPSFVKEFVYVPKTKDPF